MIHESTHLENNHQDQKQHEKQQLQDTKMTSLVEQQTLTKKKTKSPGSSLISSLSTPSSHGQPGNKNDCHDIKKEESSHEGLSTVSASSESLQVLLYSGILFKRRDYFHKQWRRRYFTLKKDCLNVLEYHLLPESSSLIKNDIQPNTTTTTNNNVRSSMSMPTQPATNESALKHHWSFSSGTAMVPTSNNHHQQQQSSISPSRISTPLSSSQVTPPRGAIELTGCTVAVDNKRSNPPRRFYAFTIHNRSIASFPRRLYASPTAEDSTTEDGYNQDPVSSSTILPTMGSHRVHLAAATDDERRRWIAAIRGSCQKNLSSQDDNLENDDDDGYDEDYYDEDGNSMYSDSSTITTLPSMMKMKKRVLVERDLKEIRQCCHIIKKENYIDEERQKLQEQDQEIISLAKKCMVEIMTPPLPAISSGYDDKANNESNKYSHSDDAINVKKCNNKNEAAVDASQLEVINPTHTQQLMPPRNEDNANKASQQNYIVQGQFPKSNYNNNLEPGSKISSSINNKNSTCFSPPPNMPEEISFSSPSTVSQEADKNGLLLDDDQNCEMLDSNIVTIENISVPEMPNFDISSVANQHYQPVSIHQSASDHDVTTTPLSRLSSLPNTLSSFHGTPTLTNPPTTDSQQPQEEVYELNNNSHLKFDAVCQKLQQFVVSRDKALVRYAYNIAPALIWIILKFLLPANTRTLTRGMTFVVLLSLGFFPVSKLALDATGFESQLLATFASQPSSGCSDDKVATIKYKTSAVTSSSYCASTVINQSKPAYKLPPIIFLGAIMLFPKMFLYDTTLITSKIQGVALIFLLFVCVRLVILSMLGSPVDLLSEGETETASRKGNVVSNKMSNDNNNSIITCRLGVDLQQVLKFISEKRHNYSDNRNVNILNINHIIVKAVAQAISEQEVLNGRRVHMPFIGIEGFYPNRGIDISVEALYHGGQGDGINLENKFDDHYAPAAQGSERCKPSKSSATTKHSNKSIVTKLTRVNEHSLDEIACQMEESESSYISSKLRKVNKDTINHNNGKDDWSSGTNSAMSDITATTSILKRSNFLEKALDRAIRFPVNRLSEVLGMKIRGATVDGNRFGSCLVLTSKAGDQTEAEVCAAALSSTAGCALPIMVFVGQVCLKKIKPKNGVNEIRVSNADVFSQQQDCHSFTPVPILPISIAIDHPVCVTTCERFAERVKQLVSFPELLEEDEELGQ